MKKIRLKDFGIYAVVGFLTTLLSYGLVGLIAPFPARLLPQVVSTRVLNISMILIHAVIYPLLWSRRECCALMRGESSTDEKTLVKRFVREYIHLQVAAQFAMNALLCVLALVTEQTSAVSNFEMCMWSLAIPFPLLLSYRIVARREIRSILKMREKGSR
ncbi:MAG: hypothetical protein IKT60_04060 [Clostridia bacterium]|nr:hypothetical protein [Clostridia bacterium]